MTNKLPKTSGYARACLRLGAFPVILQFGIFLSVSLAQLGAHGESIYEMTKGIFKLGNLFNLIIVLPVTIILAPFIIIISIVSLLEIHASKGELSGTINIILGYIMLLIPLLVYFIGYYGFEGKIDW